MQHACISKIESTRVKANTSDGDHPYEVPREGEATRHASGKPLSLSLSIQQPERVLTSVCPRPSQTHNVDDLPCWPSVLTFRARFLASLPACSRVRPL